MNGELVNIKLHTILWLKIVSNYSLEDFKCQCLLPSCSEPGLRTHNQSINYEAFFNIQIQFYRLLFNLIMSGAKVDIPLSIEGSSLSQVYHRCLTE